MRERRKKFDEFLTKYIITLDDKQLRFTCPCCGYPTLDERDGYDICILCGWEDDGQDNQNADEVWGGPNKDLSLTKARDLFEKNGVINWKGTIVGEEPFQEVRKRLIKSFEKLLTEKDTDFLQTCKELDNGFREYNQILNEKIKKYEESFRTDRKHFFSKFLHPKSKERGSK